MKVFSSILLLLALVVTTTLAAPSEKKETETAKEKKEREYKEICPKCNPKNCAPVTDCLAGLVRDRCGCCDVCGLEEDQLCSYDGEQLTQGTWYGRCGINLECRPRSDIDTKQVGNQSVCFCVNTNGYFCGTDGVTYQSLCKLTAARIASGGNVSKEHEGPCKSKPKMVQTATNIEVTEKSDVTLRCETHAFPLPQFQWTFARPNDVLKVLPGDDKDVSISTRGGPSVNQVTSQLLITNIQLKHEGTYSCLASNSVGMSSLLIRVVLKTPDKVEM